MKILYCRNKLCIDDIISEMESNTDPRLVKNNYVSCIATQVVLSYLQLIIIMDVNSSDEESEVVIPYIQRRILKEQKRLNAGSSKMNHSVRKTKALHSSRKGNAILSSATDTTSHSNNTSRVPCSIITFTNVNESRAGSTDVNRSRPKQKRKKRPFVD